MFDYSLEDVNDFSWDAPKAKYQPCSVTLSEQGEVSDVSDIQKFIANAQKHILFGTALFQNNHTKKFVGKMTCHIPCNYYN